MFLERKSLGEIFGRVTLHVAAECVKGKCSMSCANTSLPEYMIGNLGEKTPVSQKFYVQVGDTLSRLSDLDFILA